MKLRNVGLIFISLVFSMSLVSFAFAQVTPPQTSGGLPAPQTSGSPLPASQSTQTTGGPYAVQNPLGVSSLCGLIKGVLNGALDIGIPIAVLFIVYAGFKFILARGNSEKLIEARRNALYVVIGIAVFLGAWLLTQVIANTVAAIAGTSSSALSSCN